MGFYEREECKYEASYNATPEFLSYLPSLAYSHLLSPLSFQYVRLLARVFHIETLHSHLSRRRTSSVFTHQSILHLSS